MFQDTASEICFFQTSLNLPITSFTSISYERVVPISTGPLVGLLKDYFSYFKSIETESVRFTGVLNFETIT